MFTILTSKAISKEKGNSKVFINLGGYVDSQFASARQPSEYSLATLPNRESTLPSVNRQNTATGGIQSRIHSRIDLTGGVRLNEGTAIGATIVANSIVGREDNDMPGYDQNFLFIQTQYGKTQLGAMPSPAATMRIDASTIARATGGIGGDWWRFTNIPTFDTSGMPASVANELSAGYQPVFLLAPMLPNEAGFTTGASSSMFIYNGSDQSNPQMTNGRYDAAYPNRQQPRFGWGSMSNKIAYYTPRFNGFQLGVSYSPDSGNYGAIAQSQSAYVLNGSGVPVRIGGRTSSMSGDVKHLVAVGLNYKEQFGNMGIALGGTLERGEAEDIANPYGTNGSCVGTGGSCINGYNGRRDLLAWSLGGKILYGGFSIAGSYGSWGRSLQPNQNLTLNSSGQYAFPWLVAMDGNGNLMQDYEKSGFYNYGIAYGFGPINLSVTRIHTNYAGNKMSATSFGTDFRSGIGKYKGIVPYIEYTRYNMQGRSVFLQSTGQSYTPLKNSGYVFMMGIRMIF